MNKHVGVVALILDVVALFLLLAVELPFLFAGHDALDSRQLRLDVAEILLSHKVSNSTMVTVRGKIHGSIASCTWRDPNHVRCQ